MNTQWFSNLTTKRLLLRGLKLDDAADIFAYKSRTEGFQFPRVEPHKNISDSRSFVEECLKKLKENSAFYWGITLPPADTVIGTVALSAMHGDPVIGYRAEISCALSPAHRKKGIMREARICLINHAFKNYPPLIRIHSEIALDNYDSLRMNVKLGFTEEGILRSYQQDGNRKLTDIRILSLLRRDWETNSLYQN